MKKSRIVAGVGVLVLVLCAMFAWAMPFTQTSGDSLVGGASTMTKLPDGTVLLVGGDDGINALGNVQLFTTSSTTDGIFSSGVGTLNDARFLHSAASVTVGELNVLIAGGRDENGALDTAELWIFSSKTFSTTFANTMNAPRYSHTASVLSNGNVLILGGRDASGTPLATTEIFVKSSATFTTAAPTMAGARYLHTATTLTTGDVLVTGGKATTGDINGWMSAMTYSAATNSFTTVSFMTTSRIAHTATLLQNGTVLITGGTSSTGALNTAEIYNPALQSFSTPTGHMVSARYDHTATLLDNGKVLIAGGKDGNNLPLRTAEVYDPVAGVFLPTVFDMNIQKFGHQAVLLTEATVSNTVLLASGYIVDHANLTTAVPSNFAEKFNGSENLAATTTVLTSDSVGNQSAKGDIVTFTATVSKATATITGSVIFKDSGVQMGGTHAIEPVGGTAFTVIPNFVVGNHFITAEYSGDENYFASSSYPLLEMVSFYTTTIAVTSSKLNANAGENVLFTATISQGTATNWPVIGSVNFYANSTLLNVVTSAVTPTNDQGIATLMTTTSAFDPAVHDYEVYAVYSGDRWHDLSTSPAIAQTVSKWTTSITSLTTPTTTTKIGASGTLTATVSNFTTTVLRTGYVTFNDVTNGLLSSLVTVTSPVSSIGTATFNLGSLPYGVHSITALYNGDSLNNESDESSPLTLTVDLFRTTTALSTSVSNTAIGNDITFSALVQLDSDETYTNASFVGSTVTFSMATPTLVTLGTGTILSSVTTSVTKKNTAYFTTNILQIGDYDIVATYNSNGTYSSSVSSSGTPTNLTVDQKATSTVVTSSTGTYEMASGAPVSFTATISQLTTLGTCTHLLTGGTVTFRNGNVDLGVASVLSDPTDTSRGIATLDTELTFTTPGSYDITAVYSGDSHYYSSVSTTLTQVVGKEAVSIVLDASTLDKTYNGIPQAALATTYPQGLDMVITYTDSTGAVLYSPPTSAGSYFVTAFVSNNTRTGSTTGTLTIAKKQLTIAGLTADTKVFDGTTTATFLANKLNTLKGLEPVGSPDVVTYTAIGSFETSSVSSAATVSVTSVTLVGTKKDNYLVDPPTGVTGIITQKPLTVTGMTVASSRPYDGTTDATISNLGTLVGVVSDPSGSVTHTATAKFVTKTTGTSKLVSVATLTLYGPGKDNYSVTRPTLANAAITPYSLTVLATGGSKTYDGTVKSVPTLTYTPISGDKIKVTYPTTGATFDTKETGTNKLVTVTGLKLSGTTMANYTLSALTTTCTATISPRPLAIVGMKADTKEYDGTDTVTFSSSRTKGTLSGMVSRETGSDNINFSMDTASFQTFTPGNNKPITLGTITLVGNFASHYTLPRKPTVTGTITKKKLDVVGMTANTKPYDKTTAATLNSAGSLSGIVGSETVSITTATLVFKDKNVGVSKPVLMTGFTLTGADNDNYIVSLQTVSILSSITQKTLTVTAIDGSKQYDGSTVSKPTSTDDRIPGDRFVISFPTASFASKDVGTGITVTLGEPVAKGTDAGNYSLVSATTTTVSNITPKELKITGMKADVKTYDANNLVTFVNVKTRGKLSGIVTGETGSTHVDFTFVTGETSSFTSAPSGTFSYYNRNIGTNKLVSLATLSLTGDSISNYTLVAPAKVFGTVKARPLTVTAQCLPKRWDGTTTASVLLTGNTLTSLLGTGETYTDVVTLVGVATYDNSNIGSSKIVTVRSITKSGDDAINYSLSSGATVTCSGSIN